MTLTFRKYKEDDRDSILILYQKTFGKSIDRGLWEWKFLLNPAGKIFIYLAFDGSKCVGQYAMLPMSLCYHGDSLQTLVALDNMIHPDYQRKGILTDLEKIFIQNRPEEIPYYTFLNENSFHAYTSKFGWIFLGQLKIYLKPISLYSLIKRNKIWKVLSPALTFFRWIYSKKITIKACSFDKFDEDIELLWEKNMKTCGISFNRSKEYLNWRFNKSPIHYEKYKIKKNNRILGFVVLRIQEIFRFKICWVMDLLIDNVYDNELFAETLLCVDEVVKDRCDFISILLPNKRLLKGAQKVGYKQVPEKLLPHKFFFCVRQNKFYNTDIQIKDNWYFSWSLNDVL
jgi:hypothetical protein